MRCKEVIPLLIEYQENSLGLEQREMVEKHLRECGRCRKELEEIERLCHLLAEESVHSPQESFWTNFLPGVRARIESKKTRGLLIPKPRLAVGVLTVLIVAIVSVLMFTPDKRNLVERQSDQASEITLSPPELSSNSEELAEILSAESEGSLDVLLSSGEGEELDYIEGILEESYLGQASLTSVLGELDLEELKKLEEKMKALQIGDIL